MRVLVVGATGQVGRLLMRDERCVAGSRDAVDPRRRIDLTAPIPATAVSGHDVVINVAAHTAVDAAESEPAAADAVNHRGAGALAAACAESGTRLIHVSTDYVFPGTRPPDGRGLEPGDPTGPRTVYGRTKLAGERAVLAAHPDAVVVRTAWVYTGPARRRLGIPGEDFVTTMLRLAGERETVTVVADQTGSPTRAPDLAEALLALAARPDVAGRVLHYAGEGRATWYDLARAAYEESGLDPARVLPCTTADFPRPAPRPEWSVLSTGSWTGLGLPAPVPWRHALREALRADTGVTD